MMAESAKEVGRKRDRLGKGLGALLGEFNAEPESSGDVRRVPLRAIVPNPLQPRTEFSEEELDSLLRSIRENGLLQPLVVRPSPDSADRYELVAGERRFRAITQLAWDDVPVVIREVDDEALLVLALVENLQRAELNPLEEAEGYQTLMDQFSLTQEEVARSVGRSRSAVANMLRLLRLPPSVRKLVQSGELSAGHARALLSIEDTIQLSDFARQAVKEGWSVRDTERKAKRTAAGGSKKSKESSTVSADPVVRALEDELRDRLGTRVRIVQKRSDGGTIEIPFHSAEDFERVFALVAGKETSDVLD